MLRMYCLTQNANDYGTVKGVDDGTGNLCRWLRYAGIVFDSERIKTLAVELATGFDSPAVPIE